VTGKEFDFEADVPLPPGHGGVRAPSRATPTSYHVSASYPDATVEEIFEFYQRYFRENNWEFMPHEVSKNVGTLLFFDKDKASFVITILEIDSKIELSVNYAEPKYTWEEFLVLADNSAEQEAKDTVAQLKSYYCSLKSYADTGNHESIHNGTLLKKLEFETKYTGDGDLLFRYSTLLSNGFRTRNVMGRLGGVVRTMSNLDTEPEEYDEISMAISAFYGVSSATSGNIPNLLLAHEHSSLFRLMNLRVLDDAKSEDGILCARLRGEQADGDELTLSISKNDHLIREIEIVADAGNRSKTTYSPKINVEISPEEMVFRLPSDL
jgi:outer membrane lipoprotein-sorting protein